MLAVFIITQIAGVAKAQLSDGQSLFVPEESVIIHVEAGQAVVAHAPVPGRLDGRRRATIALQPALTLARVRIGVAPVALDHVVTTHPPAPARHVQVSARCKYTTRHSITTNDLVRKTAAFVSRPLQTKILPSRS